MSPAQGRVALAALACLCLVAGASAAIGNTTCVSSSDARRFMQFCGNVDWDVHGPTPADTHVIDNIAKQTYVQVLHSATIRCGKLLSKSCTVSFRKYACAYHFPKCNNVTGELIPPCREVCDHYCNTCNIGNCPCLDLPLKGDTAETTKCMTLKE
eukprot:g1382.t1